MTQITTVRLALWACIITTQPMHTNLRSAWRITTTVSWRGLEDADA